MTRIENFSGQPANYQKLEKEVGDLKKQLKKKQSKHLLSCSNLLLLLLILLVAGVVYGAYALALTGLVNVPYLTQWFYQPPVPVYQVENIDKAKGIDLAGLALKQIKAQSQLNKALPLKINLVFSDTELSAALIQLLSSGGSKPLEQCQVAVTADEVEVFALFPDPKVYLTIGLVPKIDQAGKIKFDVQKVKIGRLVLPKFIGDMFLENLILNKITQLKDLVLRDTKLTSIELASKKIYINLLLEKLSDAN